ncbi:MAG: DUF1360 domain-containing protein [Proteobacteria bacterium]|nr:DUF1360 domain-containing protein [Pseudomonadota bacterium]
MNEWMLFVLAVLATWRVTHLLASEDGPADVIFRLRRRLGDRLIGDLMDCFNCLSLWTAAVAAFVLASDFVTWALSWLALSGGACLLEGLVARPVVVERDPKPMEMEMKGDGDVLR